MGYRDEDREATLVTWDMIPSKDQAIIRSRISALSQATHIHNLLVTLGLWVKDRTMYVYMDHETDTPKDISDLIIHLIKIRENSSELLGWIHDHAVELIEEKKDNILFNLIEGEITKRKTCQQ